MLNWGVWFHWNLGGREGKTSGALCHPRVTLASAHTPLPFCVPWVTHRILEACLHVVPAPPALLWDLPSLLRDEISAPTLSSLSHMQRHGSRAPGFEGPG